MIRCELSDVPEDQCACRIHAPKPPASEIVVTARFLARFDSSCDECEKWMHEGDLIARTDDGDYICERCAS